MTDVLFHPKVVHLPMALAVLMPAVAAGIAVAWWRGWLPARAWILAVGLQAVLVVAGLVAIQTGERDEERVEAFVGESFLETHEEAAEAFVWGGGLLLGAMLVSLATARRRIGLPLAALTTLGSVVVLWLGVRVGHAGGVLVYEQGAAAAHVASSSAVTPPRHRGDHEEEDDD